MACGNRLRSEFISLSLLWGQVKVNPSGATCGTGDEKSEFVQHVLPSSVWIVHP
jgi:hypothetical protein